MPFADTGEQRIIGQEDFSGGMNCLNPAENQALEIRNGIVRKNNSVTTRPGMRAHLKLRGGYLVGFYFNQENSKQTDALHTGFWFECDFVQNAIITTIQGIAVIRLSTHDENRIIFASNGAVFLYEEGYITVVDCTPAIAATEEVNFVQAQDVIYMFRGEDLTPMYWDGSDTGFLPVTAPLSGDTMQNSVNGLYHAGRLWVTNGDDVYASNVLEPTAFDNTWQSFSIWKEQDEVGVTLWPFHESGILCFKKKRVALLTGINAAVLTGTHLSDYVMIQSVDEHSGCIAPNTLVTVGEDVWYLGYNGIYSLARNMQSKIQIQSISVSSPVQNYIDRINWNAADTSCATMHDNYVLFAVPIDGSTVPNVLLVYDRLLEVWAGVWDGALVNPLKFLKDNEITVFLSSNNVLRRMFTTDPWDSEDPYMDTPDWDATTIYQGGELVYHEYNGDQIYRALQTSQNQEPPSATYWERIDDPRNLYQIETYVKTRQYTTPPAEMRFSRASVVFRHRNPKITLSVGSRDHSTSSVIFEDVEYPQTEYDVADKEDWDQTNVNLDFNDPYRKDYTLLVDANGIWVDEDGIYGGIWESHDLRFLPIVVALNSIGIEITNTRGMIELNATRFMVSPRRFAIKEMV